MWVLSMAVHKLGTAVTEVLLISAALPRKYSIFQSRQVLSIADDFPTPANYNGSILSNLLYSTGKRFLA